MIRIRDNRDVRGPRCGNVEIDQWDAIFAYLPPADQVKYRDPELAARLEKHLRGEHVELFPRKS